ncbi:MAG: T9SS type A sorting domain-containing protein [Bacteroidota bacterium]
MKKNLLYISLLFSCTMLKAQVPNPGFEYFNQDFSVSNWGNVYLFNGTDSIVLDGYSFYTPTSDAHSGQTAIELHNAMNFTTGDVVVGAISADTDSVFSAWSMFENVPLQTAPDHLGFYYKYFPVGSDTAMATLAVYDINGNLLGDVHIVISGVTSTYTYASAPINYISVGFPATAFINFSNSIYGAPANFGTRFLIDDVEINPVTAVDEKAKGDDAMQLFPNPAKDHLTVMRNTKDFSFYIYNVEGQPILIGLGSGGTVTIPVGNLSPGIYIMKTSDGKGVERRTFVVE